MIEGLSGNRVWYYFSAALLLYAGWYINDLVYHWRNNHEYDSVFVNITLGSSPNFIAAFSLLCIFTIVSDAKNPVLDGAGVALGLVLYEFMQLAPGDYFDPFDIIFTIFGYLVIELLYTHQSQARGTILPHLLNV